MSRKINFKPIGVIHTPFQEKDDCPIQSIYSKDAIGYVEIFKEFLTGLKDIETFSHICLFYHFDQAGKLELIRQTFLDDNAHGIFATRHPSRPNGIGMSIVKLTERLGEGLRVEGVDMLDMTPLLDIKPYLPKYDRIETATEGWTVGKVWRPKPKGRE